MLENIANVPLRRGKFNAFLIKPERIQAYILPPFFFNVTLRSMLEEKNKSHKQKG